MNNPENNSKDEVQHLVEVVRALRNPQTGCPWDSVQTKLSIRKYLVEETGEYLDALEEGNTEAMKEELGDLLLQIVLNSRIAEEEGKFSLQDVAAYEAEKMIRRHPHVFGSSQAHTEEELRAQWETIKKTEAGMEQRKTALDGIPRSMPALARAHKLQSKAERAGAASPDAKALLAKLEDILKAIPEDPGKISTKEENEAVQTHLRTLLFSLVALCRKFDCNSEELLQAEIASQLKEFHL